MKQYIEILKGALNLTGMSLEETKSIFLRWRKAIKEEKYPSRIELYRGKEEDGKIFRFILTVGDDPGLIESNDDASLQQVELNHPILLKEHLENFGSNSDCWNVDREFLSGAFDNDKGRQEELLKRLADELLKE